MINTLVKKDLNELIFGEICYILVLGIFLGTMKDSAEIIPYPTFELIFTNLFFAMYLCKDFSRKGHIRVGLVENTPISRKDYVNSKYILSTIHAIISFSITVILVHLLNGNIISSIARQYNLDSSYVVLFLIILLFWQAMSINLALSCIHMFGTKIVFWCMLIFPVTTIYGWWIELLKINAIATSIGLIIGCLFASYEFYKLSIDTFENNDI